MLTKSDLSQIRKVVREEVEAEVKDSTNTLNGEITTATARVQKNIYELDDRMKNVEIRLDNVGNRLTRVENEVKKTGKNVKAIKKTVSVMLDTLDKEDVSLRKRVEKIEGHIGLASA